MDESNAKRALELYPAMLEEVGDPLKNFKKGSYEVSFQGYLERTAAHMDVVEDAYQEAEDKEALIAGRGLCKGSP